MILPDLKDNVAVVTGASQGIGRAIAELLLEQGVRVIGLDWVMADLASENYFPYLCDLANPEDIQKVFAEIKPQFEYLDHVVNVAGTDPKISLQAGGLEEWQKVMDLNLRGYYFVIRESVPLLRNGQGKTIVNISSINYRLGVPKRSIYAVSKAGILGLTTGLARELGKENIRINTVTPGWIFTEKQVEEYFKEPASREKNLSYLESVQAVAYRLQPKDIARHVLFYLSTASTGSVGHNCVVDGGWLLE